MHIKDRLGGIAFGRFYYYYYWWPPEREKGTIRGYIVSLGDECVNFGVWEARWFS